MELRYRILLALASPDPAINSALSITFDLADLHESTATHEALTFYEPDLVIIELGARLQGIELCKQMKEIQGFHQLPVIFLSETDDPDVARKAYGAGANLMLRKPIDPERLIRNVQLSLSRLGPPKSKKHPSHILSRPHIAQPAAAQPTETPPPEKPNPFAEPERSDVFLERKIAPPPTPVAHEVSAQAHEQLTLPSMPRIMMVDDDPDAIEMVQMALVDQYELLAAMDGLQALERILEYEPDLILLDVMMPKMNGYQLCHSLRRNSAYHDIPVVFLSAKTGRKDREYAFQCGATAYMTKPFEIHSLCELIAGIVEKAEFVIRPKRYAFQDIHLRERALMKEKEELHHERERRLRYEEMKNFIRKNV